MASIIKPIESAESRKQEAFITIGRHRHRIASDHHRMLSDLQASVRYVKLEQLLFITSYLGALIGRFVIELIGTNLLWLVLKITEKKVEKCAQKEEDAQ